MKDNKPNSNIAIAGKLLILSVILILIIISKLFNSASGGFTRHSGAEGYSEMQL